MTRGAFIAFEGGDGSGKSTQARRLADEIGAVLTREPGGTALGERIRAIVLDATVGSMDDRTEALLMAAARAQHTAEVIEPALAAGRHVVTDRFLASSVAYQGHGRGLDPDEILRLSLWATRGTQPDLVILLDVPPDLGAGRRGGDRDRLEAAGPAFHAAVAAGFRAQAEADPTRWLVLDGERPVEDLAGAILTEVRRRWPGTA